MQQQQELTGNTMIRRNENRFLASALGEEIVMMNTDNGSYIGINNVGSDIWNLLNEPIRVEQLVEKVMEIYEVDEERGKAEIDAFLQRMLEQDMLIVQDA